MRVEVRLAPEEAELSRGDEVRIGLWHVRPGGVVRRGELLAELVSDKAAFELRAPAGGRLVELRAAAGATVGAADVLAIIEAEPG